VLAKVVDLAQWSSGSAAVSAGPSRVHVLPRAVNDPRDI